VQVVGNVCLVLAFSLASAIFIEMGDMNTVKCPLCRVDVLIDKIDLPNRCLHLQCPLKRGEIPAPKKHDSAGDSDFDTFEKTPLSSKTRNVIV
jgi:hypothetical protein